MNSDVNISDVVETVTLEAETWLKFRDETKTKTSKTPRPRLQNCWNFLQNFVITSDFNFFQISGIFPTCFGCFLPANTTNKKSLNHRNFNKRFLCNIQSLETWNLRDQDSHKWVSRRVSRFGLGLHHWSRDSITGQYNCAIVFWTKSQWPTKLHWFR